jgi:hypothetical protein
MKITSAELEKYEQFIRGADPKTTFSESQQIDLMAQGILKIVADQPSEPSLAIIRLFILHSTDNNLIEDCFSLLSTLAKQKNQIAIEELFTLSLLYRQSSATQLIRNHAFASRYNARNAAFYLLTGQVSALFNLNRFIYCLQSYYKSVSLVEQKRLIAAAQNASLLDWLSTIELLDSLQPGTFNQGQNLFASLTTQSKRFFLGQLIHAIFKEMPHALDFSLLLYINTADPILKFILKHIPVDQFNPTHYAVFLLMAEQWQAYLAYDPRSAYVLDYYQQASSETQAKILQKTRAGGIDFFLSTTMKPQKPIGISDLTSKDWSMIIQSLYDRKNGKDMWALLQAAPPYWSVQLLEQLIALKWEPDQTDEITFFNTLITLKPDLPLPYKMSLLLPHETIAHTADISMIATHPDRTAIYEQTKQAITIYEMDKSNQSNADIIYPPKPLMPAISFSSDGRYLCWADQEQKINIYMLQQGTIIKRFPAHSSSIRSLIVSQDQRHLFSTGFDGAVQSWRFPDGSFEKSLLNDRNEIYCMVFSPVDNMLITADIAGNLHVFSTSHMDIVHSMKATGAPVLHLSNPVEGIIASCTAENQIYLWNYRSGKLINQLIPAQVLEKIISLQLSSTGQFLFVLTASGELSIRDPLSGTLYETSRFDNSTFFKLGISNDEVSLFQQNGTVNSMKFTIWQQILKPIRSTENQRLNQIDALQTLPGLTPEQNRWLEFSKSLLHWQKRYDIDIEFMNIPIKTDDYSISL